MWYMRWYILPHFPAVLLHRQTTKGATINTMQNNKHLDTTKVFAETISMDTTTRYREDGRTDIIPCDYERNRDILNNGCRSVKLQGTMVIDADGEAHFVPFSNTGEPRYKMLQRTLHGEVKTTQRNVIVHYVFPLNYGPETLRQLMRDESPYLLQAFARMATKQRRKSTRK